MKPKNIYQSVSLIAAGVAALIAVPSIWPYGVYQLVRWVICLSAGYNAYQQGVKEKYFWASTFVFIAILFNPIAPIHFDKEILVEIKCRYDMNTGCNVNPNKKR